MNKYDDTPYYAREDVGNPQPKVVNIEPPKPKSWGGLQATAHAPSPLYLWCQEETWKRSNGQMNEICINQMKAGLKGTKNKFIDVIKDYRTLIEAFCDKPTKEIYADIMALMRKS